MRTSRLCVALAVGVLGPVLLAGCSLDGSDDDEPYQASIGTNARTDDTDALGFALVVDGDGNGRVVGTLINTTEAQHALVGAQVDGERGQIRASVIGDSVPLPPDEPVELAREPAIAVSAEDLPEGLFVELTLDISGAEPIEMLVPVEPQRGPYADVEVTEAPDGDISPDSVPAGRLRTDRADRAPAARDSPVELASKLP